MVLERVKRFTIFFLYLVPVNTQNEIDTKITSKSAVIKEIWLTTPLLIQKKNMGMQGETNRRSVSFSNISETKLPLITFI